MKQQIYVKILIFLPCFMLFLGAKADAQALVKNFNTNRIKENIATYNESGIAEIVLATGANSTHHTVTKMMATIPIT